MLGNHAYEAVRYASDICFIAARQRWESQAHVPRVRQALVP